MAVVSSGSSIQTNKGSISYSIGQIDYTNFGGNIIIYMGVQQIYDPFLNSIDDSTGFSIWPNPVFTVLHVDVKSTNNLGIIYQIYSIDGKLLDSKLSTHNRTTINMMNYAQGLYVLMVRFSSKRTFNFKIIKN